MIAGLYRIDEKIMSAVEGVLWHAEYKHGVTRAHAVKTLAFAMYGCWALALAGLNGTRALFALIPITVLCTIVFSKPSHTLVPVGYQNPQRSEVVLRIMSVVAIQALGIWLSYALMGMEHILSAVCTVLAVLVGAVFLYALCANPLPPGYMEEESVSEEDIVPIRS